MIESLAMLSYFGVMLLPLFFRAVIEHHASEIIENRHHKAILENLQRRSLRLKHH